VHNAGGFEVQIVGVSTTRELTRATVRFHASAAGNLQTSQVTVALADAGKSWFQNASSAAFGGQFTLTLPFTFVGAANVLDSVSVVLSNSVGDSTEASGSY